MGLHVDIGAGILDLGEGQHLGEGAGIGARGGDRSVAMGLVDDQNIAREGRIAGKVVVVVFRQFQCPESRHRRPRTFENGKIVERLGGQDPLQAARPGGIEMHARAVEHEAERRLAGAAGADRAQEGILDAQEPGAAPFGQLPPAPGSRALAPDADQILRPGQAEADVVAGQFQDAPHPALDEEAAIVDVEPAAPGGGCRARAGHRAQLPAAVEIEFAAPTEPVKAEIDFCHCTKGASVT